MGLPGRLRPQEQGVGAERLDQLRGPAHEQRPEGAAQRLDEQRGRGRGQRRGARVVLLRIAQLAAQEIGQAARLDAPRRAASLVVRARLGQEVRAVAGGRDAAREVQVLEVDEEVLVEAPELGEHAPAHEVEGAHDVVDVARLGVVPLGHAVAEAAAREDAV